MICKKCKNSFKMVQSIDGKMRNLSNRKFCLECSPFGHRNTSPLCLPPDQNRKHNDIIIKKCTVHGETEHVCRKNLQFRCKKCCIEITTNKRREKKAKLVSMFGGGCSICGYKKCQQALQFHHLDPSNKERGVSWGNISLDKLLKEANKCILLCANCHAEVEAGLSKISERILLTNDQTVDIMVDDAETNDITIAKEN